MLCTVLFAIRAFGANPEVLVDGTSCGDSTSTPGGTTCATPGVTTATTEATNRGGESIGETTCATPEETTAFLEALDRGEPISRSTFRDAALPEPPLGVMTEDYGTERESWSRLEQRFPQRREAIQLARLHPYTRQAHSILLQLHGLPVPTTTTRLDGLPDTDQVRTAYWKSRQTLRDAVLTATENRRAEAIQNDRLADMIRTGATRATPERTIPRAIKANKLWRAMRMNYEAGKFADRNFGLPALEQRLSEMCSLEFDADRTAYSNSQDAADSPYDADQEVATTFEHSGLDLQDLPVSTQQTIIRGRTKLLCGHPYVRTDDNATPTLPSTTRPLEAEQLPGANGQDDPPMEPQLIRDRQQAALEAGLLDDADLQDHFLEERPNAWNDFVELVNEGEPSADLSDEALRQRVREAIARLSDQEAATESATVKIGGGGGGNGGYYYSDAEEIYEKDYDTDYEEAYYAADEEPAPGEVNYVYGTGTPSEDEFYRGLASPVDPSPNNPGPYLSVAQLGHMARQQMPLAPRTESLPARDVLREELEQDAGQQDAALQQDLGIGLREFVDREAMMDGRTDSALSALEEMELPTSELHYQFTSTDQADPLFHMDPEQFAGGLPEDYARFGLPDNVELMDYFKTYAEPILPELQPLADPVTNEPFGPLLTSLPGELGEILGGTLAHLRTPITLMLLCEAEAIPVLPLINVYHKPASAVYAVAWTTKTWLLDGNVAAAVLGVETITLLQRTFALSSTDETANLGISTKAETFKLSEPTEHRKLDAKAPEQDMGDSKVIGASNYFIRFTVSYAKSFISTKLGMALTGLSKSMLSLLPTLLAQIADTLPIGWRSLKTQSGRPVYQLRRVLGLLSTKSPLQWGPSRAFTIMVLAIPFLMNMSYAWFSPGPYLMETATSYAVMRIQLYVKRHAEYYVRREQLSNMKWVLRGMLQRIYEAFVAKMATSYQASRQWTKMAQDRKDAYEAQWKKGATTLNFAQSEYSQASAEEKAYFDVASTALKAAKRLGQSQPAIADLLEYYRAMEQVSKQPSGPDAGDDWGGPNLLKPPGMQEVYPPANPATAVGTVYEARAPLPTFAEETNSGVAIIRKLSAKHQLKDKPVAEATDPAEAAAPPPAGGSMPATPRSVTSIGSSWAIADDSECAKMADQVWSTFSPAQKRAMLAICAKGREDESMAGSDEAA